MCLPSLAIDKVTVWLPRHLSKGFLERMGNCCLLTRIGKGGKPPGGWELY